MEGSFSFGGAPQIIGTEDVTFTHLLDQFPGMFFKCKNDGNWTLLLLSKGCETLSGYSQYDLKQNNKNILLDFIHPEDRERVIQFRTALFESKNMQIIEYRIICKNGNEKFVREHAIAYTIPESGEQGIEGHLKDLTEWKKQEQSLKKEQEYSQKIIGRMSEGFIMTDPSGIVINVNESLCNITGYSKEELIGSVAPYPFWAPEHLEEIIHSFQQAWEGKKTECQLIFKKKNGERFNARVRPSSVKKEDGSLEFFFATINDVSIETEFRKKIVESEHWLNEAQRIANMGNWEFNPKTNEVKWSKNAYHIYEYPENSNFSHYDWFMQKLHPDDVIRVQEAYDEAVKFKSNYDSVHRLVFDSGYVKWVREIGEIIYDEKGEPEIVIGTVTDITPQKNIEEQLKLYQYAIDSAITGIAMGDLDGKITFVNDAFREMFGYDQASEVIGKNPEELLAGKNKNEVIPHILEKGAWKGEIVAKRKNETTFVCEMVANVARNEFGHPIGLFASFQDISDRIKTHEALRNSELNLKIMFNSNPSPMVVSRLSDGLMLLGNEALEKTFLVRPDDYIGKPTTLFYVDPDDRFKLVEELQQFGEVKGMEVELKRKNGQRLICSVSSEVINLFEEKVLLSTLTDITEIKRNQLKLAESEQRLNLAQRIAKIGCWEFDAKTGSLIWSDELYSIFDLDPSLEGPALLQSYTTRIAPKHYEPLMVKFNNALSEGISYNMEHDIVLDDGSTKTLFCTG
jgi:PAS domain S-box-containing protein